MADTAEITRPASEVRESLRLGGLSVTYARLAQALGHTKVTGTTTLTGSDEEIKGQLIATTGETPAITDESSDESTVAKVADKVKKGARKSAKKAKEAVGLTTSNRPPAIERTETGEETAADLMCYLGQYPVPQEFPFDLTKFRRAGVQWVKGTTVDGVVVEKTLSEAAEALMRRDDLAYAIPLFSEKVEREIVTRVAKLDGAPAADATDENELKLFASHKAWFYNLLQIGIRIWAGMNNPPSLNLEAFPHRTGIEVVTFRYRPAVLGFVARIVEAFEEESLGSGLTGSKLRDFRDDWVDQFIRGERTVKIGPSLDEKSFKDFRVDGRQGSAEKFKSIWGLVTEQQKQRELAARQRSKSTPRRRTGRN